jgi:hypothetical protein
MYCSKNYLLSGTDHKVKFSHLHVREFVQMWNEKTGVLEEASVLSKSEGKEDKTVDLLFDTGRTQNDVPYGQLDFKDESTHQLLQDIDRKWSHVLSCERMLSLRCPGLADKVCVACAAFKQNARHLLDFGCLHETNIKLACYKPGQPKRSTIDGRKTALQHQLEKFRYPVNLQTTALLRHLNGSNPKMNLVTALRHADVGLKGWSKRLSAKCHTKVPKHYVTELHFALPFLQCAEIVYKLGHSSELKKCRGAIDNRFGGKSGPGCEEAVFTPGSSSIISRFMLFIMVCRFIYLIACASYFPFLSCHDTRWLVEACRTETLSCGTNGTCWELWLAKHAAGNTPTPVAKSSSVTHGSGGLRIVHSMHADVAGGGDGGISESAVGDGDGGISESAVGDGDGDISESAVGDGDGGDGEISEDAVGDGSGESALVKQPEKNSSVHYWLTAGDSSVHHSGLETGDDWKHSYSYAESPTLVPSLLPTAAPTKDDLVPPSNISGLGDYMNKFTSRIRAQTGETDTPTGSPTAPTTSPTAIPTTVPTKVKWLGSDKEDRAELAHSIDGNLTKKVSGGW